MQIGTASQNIFLKLVIFKWPNDLRRLVDIWIKSTDLRTTFGDDFVKDSPGINFLLDDQLIFGENNITSITGKTRHLVQKR